MRNRLTVRRMARLEICLKCPTSLVCLTTPAEIFHPKHTQFFLNQCMRCGKAYIRFPRKKNSAVAFQGAEIYLPNLCPRLSFVVQGQLSQRLCCVCATCSDKERRGEEW